MAAYSSTRLKEREISPERTKVWTEPKPKRVPVVYYLSRNGFLEHPHFMEVPLSSPHHGLYLKDVIGRLNVLRGKGMASSYSWSSKRGYKNGFVWQDLSEDDLIHPVHNHEYVLKGSELLLNPSSSTSRSASSSSRFEKPLEISRSEERPKKKPPSRLGSIDLNEYKIYRSSDLNADAATQTEVESKKMNLRRSHNRDVSRDEIEIEVEISPPPSSSSSETVEESIGGSGRSIATVGSSDDQDRTVGSFSSGRFKASAVLMQLVSCGSVSTSASAKEGEEEEEEEEMTRGRPDEEVEGLMVKSDVGGGGLVNKEYFSGSLVEMKKKGGDHGAGMVPVLKRSNSYDADRGLKLELVEKEMEGVHSKCIPRRFKTSTVARIKGGSLSINCRSTQGNKRINDEPTTN